MKRNITLYECDRCGTEYEDEQEKEALSELALDVADSMGWSDLCANCHVILNAIVTGESDHKLVPKKRGGGKHGKSVKSGEDGPDGNSGS